MRCQSELQNAFSLSQMEREPDDTQKIRELRAAGRCVVYLRGTDYCRLTDAILGSRLHYLGDFATMAEADAFARQQPGYDDCGDDFEICSVGPPAEVLPVVEQPASDDIPF